VNIIAYSIVMSMLFTVIFLTTQQQVQAWELTMDLSNSGDFGDNTVCGSVRGQYGWYDSLCTDNGPSASISFDIPDDSIPVGSSYVVCSWSNSIGIVSYS